MHNRNNGPTTEEQTNNRNIKITSELTSQLTSELTSELLPVHHTDVTHRLKSLRVIN